MDGGRARCPAGLRSAGKLLASLIYQAVAWLGTVVAAERERGDRAVRAVGRGTGVAVTREYAAGCTGCEKFIRQADAASRHLPYRHMWGQISQGAEMQLTIYHSGTSEVWADALFASVLQRSDSPSAGQVRKAIAATVRAYGGLGCVQRVAQEFGDHPEAAVDRMRWARAVADEVFASPSAPAQQSLRRQPGPPVASLPRWRLAG